ncbi:MAG: hypothetical protein ACP5LD_10350 [Desulfomonilaceae bacterium]
MNFSNHPHPGKNSRRLLSAAILFALLLILPTSAGAEIYGVKDAAGNFQPRLDITIGNKEVILKKVNPQDRFRSLAITLNPKNAALVRNVGLLNMEWVNSAGKAGKEVQFAGPRYDPTTRRFEDAMGKSIEVRILDKSNRNLFAGKTLSELFDIHVDDMPLVSSQSVTEKDRTVQMGHGRDVSLNIDKQAVVFNENNFKKGEILNIDNRSGANQTVGIDLPEKGLLYYQIIKKPEQTKIPREAWKRFTIPPDSGVFVVLIPEPDPVQLAMINGKNILIRVYQGTIVKDTLRVPITVASDLVGGPATTPGNVETATPAASAQSPSSPAKTPAALEAASTAAGHGAERQPAAGQPSSSDAKIWVALGVNLGLLAVLAGYVIFFMLPKIQVLQDRIAKSEIFIHHSRESIREELEAVKADILSHISRPPGQE